MNEQEPVSYIGVKLYYHGIDENGEGIFKPYPKSSIQKFDSAPAIHTDEIAPWTGHATQDTPVFTSRAKRDAYLKKHQFAIKEKGLDYGKRRGPEDLITTETVRDCAERALYDEKYQRVPHSEKEKELCRREERTYKGYLQRRGEKVRG